jgi:hypothetical protein
MNLGAVSEVLGVAICHNTMEIGSLRRCWQKMEYMDLVKELSGGDNDRNANQVVTKT